MKIKLRILGLLIGLCSAIGTTAVFGQTTYVWTNQNPALLTTGDLNRGANWTTNGAVAAFRDPGGVPRPDFMDGILWGDEMLFDGRTTGPLLVTQTGGVQVNGSGSGQPYGLRVHLSSNQTSPVSIVSPVAVSAGMRMNYFTIDAGSGGLRLGTNGQNILDILAGVLTGQIFGFTNNSATPSVINADVRFRMGGAGFHQHIFAGTGDWIVNNHMRSANSSAIGVVKDGPGTMTWFGTNVGPQGVNWFDNLGTPVRITGGTLIIKSSDCVDTGAGGPAIVHNGVLLKYDVQPTAAYVTTPTTIPGVISGGGPIEVSAGTVTLSGANTFTGNINLTGGKLIAGSTENFGVNGPFGQGGIISLNGGTLGWSPANAFDYSSRLNTSANQVYNFDTGGSSPTFATGLTSSGGSLAKTGGGTLTLAGANTYTGPTTVSVGGLLFQGTMSGTGNMSVSDGATLGVTENGSQIRPGTLTVGTSTGATLEFNNVTNHATATLAPTNLISVGVVTININSGRFFSIGETFPLLSWTSGSAPAVSLGFLAGAGGHLATNGNEIDLVIDDPPYVWTAAANTTWNTTSVDWTRSGAPVTWVNAHFALLDDTAGNGNITMSGTIAPTNTTINNSALAYTLNNSAGNVIGGPGGLTKNGNGTLTLPGGANTYTGVTTVGGGVLAASVLANGGSPSDIGAASTAATNIVLNGGTLQYTGTGVTIDRLFAVGPSGGTIESAGASALVLNNTGSLAMSGNGPRTLTLTGVNSFGDTIASAIVNHPAGTSLTKNGAGTWILTGTNTYAGGSTILNGTLQVGANGGTGSLGGGNVSIASGTTIDFQRTGTLLVPGSVTGNGAVVQNGSGTVVLANNNTYNGGTTISAGTLQVGNGGGSGSLLSAAPIVNNSLLDFNTAGTFTYGSGGNGIISGSGNVIVRGGGFIKAIGNNSYTGWTRIDPNTTFQPLEGQDGGMLTSVITNNGTLRLVRQDALITYPGNIVGSGRVQIGANAVNFGVITLTGTNTYSGGTFIGGNTLVLGDGVTPISGSIAGNVQFVNNVTISQDNPRTITFNRPDDFTFGGTITTNFATPQANQGVVQQLGTGRLTLTGNNTYGSGTTISAGIVQVGAGGGSGTLGFGNVTDNSQLVFNRTGTLAVGTVTGAGSITNIGTGTVTLTGPSSIAGNLDLQAGSFGAAPLIAIGSMTVGGSMNIASGVTVLAGVNRLLSPSNTTYTVTGPINYTSGGTLRLLNNGPLLQVGDKFTIFNQPVTNMAVVLPGFTVQNNLALDGSVTVTAATPLTLTTSSSGVGTNLTLTLTWPLNWSGGAHVQAQTNAITKGLSTNWVTIVGSDSTNVFTTTVGKANGSVFYRLIAP